MAAHDHLFWVLTIDSQSGKVTGLNPGQIQLQVRNSRFGELTRLRCMKNRDQHRMNGAVWNKCSHSTGFECRSETSQVQGTLVVSWGTSTWIRLRQANCQDILFTGVPSLAGQEYVDNTSSSSLQGPGYYDFCPIHCHALPP